MRAAFALVGIALGTLSVVNGQEELAGPCPNFCSGNGLCVLTTCNCFDGYIGGDCSLQKCPYARSWNDHASAEDSAHNLAECSDRGSCDRFSGRCSCDAGFSGRACDESVCPNSCSGRGKCVSMRYLALYKDPGQGQIYSYDEVWDADKNFGCLCDEGFHGYDCSLRHCPVGDDPMTVSQVDEKQLLRCSSSGGFFTVTFKGHTSEPIPYNTLLADFEIILQATPGIGDVAVVFSEVGLGVCSSVHDQVVSITFLEHFGDVDSLVIKSTHIPSCADPDVGNYDLCGGVPVTVATDGGVLSSTTDGSLFSIMGTKENEYCSRRGTCDTLTGVCTCFTNFITSDGRGNEGQRGDCGYDSTEIQSCPGLISCSGHGNCNQANEYRCSCSVGWLAGDCSERACPVGKSWFDLPISDNRAHQLVECSNKGICDRIIGECRCHTGFTGAACDQIVCPGSPTQCSGHGQCLSMAQLANYALTNGASAATTYGDVPNDPHRWDHDMMHGCDCDAGWEGHDCNLKSCPKGDDPETGYLPGDLQVHEIQAFQCIGDGGSIKFLFRTVETDAIPWNMGVSGLKGYLEAIESITEVEVTFSTGNTMCTTDGSNVVSLKFVQELGALPALTGFYQTNGVTLTHGSGTPALNIASAGGALGGVTTQTGTMENIECSGRGTCNHETGVCHCFPGFGSSNGNLQKGQRGDCGWKVPYSSSSS